MKNKILLCLIIVNFMVSNERGMSVTEDEAFTVLVPKPSHSSAKSLGGGIREEVRKLHKKFENFISLPSTTQEQLIVENRTRIDELNQIHKEDGLSKKLRDFGFAKGSSDETYQKNSMRLEEIHKIIEDYDQSREPLLQQPLHPPSTLFNILTLFKTCGKKAPD